MIRTSDIKFANLDALSGQVRKLYGNGYDAVIHADVSGSSSNAFKIDRSKKEYGDYDLAEGISSTILLGSFGSAGANKGTSVAELKLCCLKPDSFNHNKIFMVLWIYWKKMPIICITAHPDKKDTGSTPSQILIF